MPVSVEPFQIAIADSTLADLRRRLDQTALPPFAPGATWETGCDPGQLGAFLADWRDAFDWREVEQDWNRHTQFIATVAGTPLHGFRFGAGQGGIPLLMLHGWPGSFVELLACAQLLAQGTPAFEVVVPSLPGFGFSPRPPGPLGFAGAAERLAELMSALGYPRFYVQGGDIGAGIGSALALNYPERVIGLHLNFIPGSYRPALPDPPDLSSAEAEFLAVRARWIDREGAYSHLHGTKPLSLAVAMHDSPAGLAAWILHKFATWADCGGDLSRLPREALAANLTLYWVTRSFASSIEFYRDSRAAPLHLQAGQRISPPCAVADFPYELPLPPRSYVARGYNIVGWTRMPRGGHFAALEAPDLLAADVRDFVTATG